VHANIGNCIAVGACGTDRNSCRLLQARSAQASRLGESRSFKGWGSHIKSRSLSTFDNHNVPVCVPQVLCQLAPMLSKHLLSVTPVVAQVSTKTCLSNPEGRLSRPAWICFTYSAYDKAACRTVMSHLQRTLHLV